MLACSLQLAVDNKSNASFNLNTAVHRSFFSTSLPPHLPAEHYNQKAEKDFSCPVSFPFWRTPCETD